jgi:hypothetical protein
MLKEFQALFGERSYSNLHNRWQADFEIKMDPNGEIPLRSLYLTLVTKRKNSGTQ